MWTPKKIREAYQTANARNAINNAMKLMKITTMLLKASDKSILVFYKVSHFIILNNAMFAKTISLKEPKRIVITPTPYIVYKAFPFVVPNASYT